MTDQTHKPIEEILDQTPSEPADQQAEKEAKRARDKRGRFADAKDEPGPPDDHRAQPKPADTATASATAESEDGERPSPDQAWSYAAYRDEKDKRQKTETRAQRTEQMLHQARQQLAELMNQQRVPAIDPIENPQGFAGELQQGVQAELKKIRLENSLQISQMRHGEVFDKAYEDLIDAAYSGDKASYLRVMNSPNIGEAIVQWHRERTALTEIGNDPDKWREAEREKLRAEIEAEISNPSRQPQQQVQQPSNLAGVRNVGTRSGPAWSGPASLDDIFAKGRR